MLPPKRYRGRRLARGRPNGELPSVDDELRDLDELLDALEAFEKTQEGDTERK